jgi:hypothetical protein
MISVLMDYFASFHFSPIVALGVRRVRQRLHDADEFVENVNEKPIATRLSCRELFFLFSSIDIQFSCYFLGYTVNYSSRAVTC